MGYDLESFLDKDKISSELICSLCNGVMERPLMITTCKHMFCGKCIQDWYATSKTCPTDKEEIPPPLKLKSPPRPTIDTINDLARNCRFGCSEAVRVEDIKSHEGGCEANQETAKECVSKCGAVVRSAELESHNCIQFLKEKVELSWARKAQVLKELEQTTEKLIKEKTLRVNLEVEVAMLKGELCKLNGGVKFGQPEDKENQNSDLDASHVNDTNGKPPSSQDGQEEKNSGYADYSHANEKSLPHHQDGARRQTPPRDNRDRPGRDSYSNPRDSYSHPRDQQQQWQNDSGPRQRPSQRGMDNRPPRGHQRPMHQFNQNQKRDSSQGQQPYRERGAKRGRF